MTKRILPVFFIVSCFLKPGCLEVHGQSGPLEAISGKFIDYCTSVPREEVFVHTDREKYIAGEDLWFKVYLSDRQTNGASASSRLVYFEIINPDNHAVAAKRIELINGSGPGHIILPDTLSSGNYTIRAYTSWMKNFLPSNCFLKDIQIYNALSNRNFKIKGSLYSVGEKNPESKSGSASGICYMKTASGDPENIRISIFADDKFISSKGLMCYLFIQTRGNINFTGSVRLSGDSTVVYVPRRNLMPGINHLTIFDSAGSPVSECFHFTPPDGKKELLIQVNEKPGVRDHVQMEISGPESQALVNGRMSISVAPLADSAYSSDVEDYMIFASEFGILPDNIVNNRKDEIPVPVMEEFLSSLKSNWIDWDVILKGELPELRYQHENETHFIYGKMGNTDTGAPVAGEYIFLSKPGKIASFRYARTDTNGSFSFELPLSAEVQDIVIQPENISKELKIRLESPFLSDFIPAGRSSNALSGETPPFISEWSANYQVRKIYGISSAGKPLFSPDPLPVFTRFYGKPDIEVRMDDFIKLPVMSEVFFELVPGVYLREKKSGWEFSIFELSESRVNSKPPGIFIDGVVVMDASSVAGIDPELVEKIDVVKDVYLVGRYIFYGIINVITRKGDFSCISLPDYAVRLPIRVTEPVPSFFSPDYDTRGKKQSSLPDFRNTLLWDPSPVAGKDGKISIDFWTSDYVTDYVITVQGVDSKGSFISGSGFLRVK